MRETSRTLNEELNRAKYKQTLGAATTVSACVGRFDIKIEGEQYPNYPLT